MEQIFKQLTEHQIFKQLTEHQRKWLNAIAKNHVFNQVYLNEHELEIVKTTIKLDGYYFTKHQLNEICKNYSQYIKWLKQCQS